MVNDMVYVPPKPLERKKSKYKNKKVEFLGRKFDSIIERDRYIFLKDEQRRGAIKSLRCQVAFNIDINGQHICKYIADFTYEKLSAVVVEDVKGVLTDVFKLKKKMMRAALGIDIKIVKEPTLAV